MRVQFGFFFEIQRDSPDPIPDREGDASSHVERLPEELELQYESRVAPVSKPVLGFRPRHEEGAP